MNDKRPIAHKFTRYFKVTDLTFNQNAVLTASTLTLMFLTSTFMNVLQHLCPAGLRFSINERDQFKPVKCQRAGLLL